MTTFARTAALGFDPIPDELLYREPWHDQASCRGYDQLFFGPLGEHKDARTRRERQAKAFCGSCPVAAECLDEAMILGEPFGIRGGLNPAERQRLNH